MGLNRFEKGEKILKDKLIYTVFILFVYILGKEVPLYMVDVSAYLHETIDAEGMLLQTINGDVFRCSIFALGISPFMIASIIVQVIASCRSSEKKAKISPVKTNKLSLTLTVLIALIQAVVRVADLQFRVEGPYLMVARLVAVVEMVTGVMLIVWLCSRNRKYGIGGQSALIYVNILEGIFITLQSATLIQVALPLAVSFIVMVVMLFMENTELRIPLQRISVHNIYADKNYLAIKCNPVGVMPAMFSMAFFMLPQLITQILGYLFPTNAAVLWLEENMTLGRPLGIGIYIVLLYVLTLGFSRVFVNPGELTEQFLKSGDSLVGIHAGRDTYRYLNKAITWIGFLSATVMSICLGVPMVLQWSGSMENAFVMLPSSVMMLTGIWCNLDREVQSIKDLEAYKPFI